MEIPPIPNAPTFRSAPPVRATAPAADAPDGPRPFRSETGQPIGSTSDDVGVEISWRSPMVQVVRFIDVHTGEVLSQTPSEQVLALVQHVMEQVRRREG